MRILCQLIRLLFVLSIEVRGMYEGFIIKVHIPEFIMRFEFGPNISLMFCIAIGYTKLCTVSFEHRKLIPRIRQSSDDGAVFFINEFISKKKKKNNHLLSIKRIQ